MEQQQPQESLLEALDAGELERARTQLAQMHPSEVADLLESIPVRRREEAWDLIGAESEGEVLSEMQADARTWLLDRLDPRELAEITRDLDADDVADILQDLPGETVDSVLLSMDAQNRAQLNSVLAYPEDTAGGLMNIDVISVRADVTLDTVMRYLHKRGEMPEQTDSLMVVDRQNRYLGVLWLSDLLTRPPGGSVGEYLKPGAGIAATTSAHDVARLFEQRDLLSAAVVGEDGKLLGRITVDDVVDVIQEEADHTLRHMAGLGGEDTFAPVWLSTRRRAVWLGINLLTAFLASWVIGRFEDAIEQLVALAVLMPIVASMGGIAGSQTLTIAIRGLALGQISRANARSLLAREFAVAVFNGLIWASVVAAVAVLWFDSRSLGVIIGAALMINLLIAALAGALIPLSLKHFGVDPAIAGGVLLTTVTDVVGFVTFLGLATIFLLP